MIACVYCGGEHERPAEVKQCWADHQGVEPDAPSRSGTPPAPTDAPTPSVEPARRGGSVPSAPGRRLQPLVAALLERGPAQLGRNVVVATGDPIPDAWIGCDEITIDRAVLSEPAPMLATIRAAAHECRAHVFRVGGDLDLAVGPRETDDREPFDVGVAHSFDADELIHLLVANSIDLRREPAGWHLVDDAVALGASVVDASGTGDVVTPDGRPIWLDGGPLGFREAIDGVDVVHAVQIEHGRFAAPSTNDSDADLAPDQLAAVTHAGGAARIIAPAGSGKTRVLTERARHVLTNWKVPATALTLVAFNKRAQEEMQARTADLPGLHVRTLNAIALAIVNGSPPFAPQHGRWRTIDEPDVRRILGRLVQTPRRLNIDPLATWMDALSLVRLGLVEPNEAEARYGGDVDGLADVWPQYRAALERDGAVDFDDQIYRAITVLLTQPDARAAAQRACRLLLVDEFQDLSPSHLLLVRLLAAPGGAVFGVGDDDQTIYGYNGADPSWLIDFATWFPGAASHPLEVNYRCPAGVVEVADRLLRHNRRRVDKTIRAASADAGGWVAVDGDDPIGATMAALQGALRTGASPSDVAVLTRVNAVLAPVQAALCEAGHPISGGVGAEFMERTAVRATLAWLRLGRGTGFAATDIGEALRRPSRGLSPRLRDWVGEQNDLDGLERLAARLNNDRDATKVRDFAVDLARLGGLIRRGASTGEVFDLLIDEIGLGGAVSTLDAGRRGTNRSAQGDDLAALRHLARLQPDIGAFERWLHGHLVTRRDPAGVTLSTVHRVKGQEWPHVIAHLVEGDQYPHRLSEDLEEERRLLHVAITRCREHVTVVSGDHPSPFVAEFTTEPPEHPPEPTPPVRRSVPPTSQQRSTPDHPLLDRSVVMAVVGLVLVDQGHEWTVTDLEPEAAVAEREGSTRRFRIGSKVETLGKQRGELGVRSGDVTEEAARVFDRLRQFRDRARTGKPAYTVFDDKTLAGIATALPVDLDQLARVKGVGPAKLDQYGDDVLAVVANAISAG